MSDAADLCTCGHPKESHIDVPDGQPCALCACEFFLAADPSRRITYEPPANSNGAEPGPAASLTIEEEAVEIKGDSTTRMVIVTFPGHILALDTKAARAIARYIERAADTAEGRPPSMTTWALVRPRKRKNPRS